MHCKHNNRKKSKGKNSDEKATSFKLIVSVVMGFVVLSINKSKNHFNIISTVHSIMLEIQYLRKANGEVWNTFLVHQYSRQMTLMGLELILVYMNYCGKAKRYKFGV